MSDNAVLIDIAARLLDAAAKDERLIPLAKEAKELLMKDDTAILELLSSHASNASPMPTAPQFTAVSPPAKLKVEPTAQDKQEAIAILQAILAKAT